MYAEPSCAPCQALVLAVACFPSPSVALELGMVEGLPRHRQEQAVGQRRVAGSRGNRAPEFRVPRGSPYRDTSNASSQARLLLSKPSPTEAVTPPPSERQTRSLQTNGS